MHNPTRPPLRQVPPPQHSPTPALDSTALFGKGGEVLIAHGSETYRLRLTRQGKLILTK